MSRPVLDVRDLDAFYGASHVLHRVSLVAGEGELVALLGRNGAGKTTTFGALVGIVRGRGGDIVVDGEPLAGTSTYRRSRRGLVLVPSGARVFPNLTVEENLAVVRPRRADGDGWTASRVYEHFPKLAGCAAARPATCRAASARCWRSAAG